MRKLSLVVITLNEEKNIKQCIQSVPFADEIIVVDSGSKDRTEEIAKSLNANFIFNKWPGYGKQKQFAIEQAQNDWVLLLDADEYLDTDLQNEIKEILNSKDMKDGYFLARKQIFMNKICQYGKSVDHPLRLVNKSKGQFDQKDIHESFVSNGITDYINGFIIHNSGITVLDRCKKIIRDLELEILNDHSKSISKKEIFIDPFIYFFSYFVKKQGYKDGVPGFIMTGLFAIHIFLLNAARYEKIQTNKY